MRESLKKPISMVATRQIFSGAFASEDADEKGVRMRGSNPRWNPDNIV
jgi:hypothetical protein